MRERSIAGWTAKSKLSSVRPSGRFETLSEVFTPHASRPERSAASSWSSKACGDLGGADRLAEKAAEALGSIAATEREQPLTRGINVEPGLRRAHRATV
jgi:hypothetical protein